MIESPLINELLARRTQDNILRVLKRRFGKVPHDLANQLRSVVKEKQLDQLLDHAADCRDVEAFREHLFP